MASIASFFPFPPVRNYSVGCPEFGVPHPQPLLRSSTVITNSFSRSILKTNAIHLDKLKIEMSLNILRILLLSTHSCLCPSMFGHFLHPNFARPIQAHKRHFQQQVPRNIQKHKKISCPTNPFHHLTRATPKTTRKSKTLLGPWPFLLAASTLVPAEISCSTTAP
jgi:hypothetical protein